MCIFYRWLLLPLLILGCPYVSGMVFQPKVGDSCEYSTQIQMDFEVQEGLYKSQKASISTIVLMNYRVQSVTNTVAKIEVKPLFIEASSAGMSGLSFSSINASKDDERTALLQGGFVFDIELSTGKILAMEAIDQAAWQEFIKYNSDKELKKFVNQQVIIPFITQQLRDKEGEKVHLANFMGMTDITVIVEKVTDDRVQLSITAQGQQNAFARMIVERKTGWPIEITMLSQQIVTENNIEVNMQMALFMKKGRNSLFTSPIRAVLLNKQQNINHVVDSQAMLKKLSKTKPLIEKEIFPQDTGVFINNRNELVLLYINNLERYHTVGVFKFSNLTLLDSKGKPLALNLLGADDGSFLDYQTIVGYTPLEWGLGTEILKSIVQVKASVDFYPSEMKTISMDASATQPQKVQASGIDIELKPTDKQGAYLLTYTLSEDYWLNPQFIAGVGKNATISPINPPESIFSWLAPEYSSLINQTSIDRKRTFYYKLFLPSKPKQLTFFISHNSGKLAFSKDLVFIDQKAYKENVHLPPLDERTSYLMQATKGDLGELKPQGGGSVHNLQFKLPIVFAPYCQLTVLNKPTVHNQLLQWKKVEYGRNDNAQLWQLQTADDVIQYFYGLTVNSQLLCNGYEAWQAIAYQRHPTYPWLLDLAQLSKNLPDIKQPVSTLYNNYRFLNDRGEILLPSLRTPIQEFENEDILLGRQIEDFLVDGQYIRMTGVPVTIEQKIFVNEEVKNMWQTTFDPIICEQGDTACPN